MNSSDYVTKTQSGYRIFTDGACLGNPGPGGYGALVADPSGRVLELGGHLDNTTNNRMEMLAIIKALSMITSPVLPVTILSDSSYCLNGIKSWRKKWRVNGWRNEQGEPIANQDLWQELDALIHQMESQGFNLNLIHVRGHVGIPGNERVDTIATEFAAKKQPLLFNGSREDYPFDLSIETAANSTRAKSNSSTTTKNLLANRGRQPIGYMSCVANVVEFHKTWSECQKRVHGRAANFCKVFSQEEIDAFRRKWQP